MSADETVEPAATSVGRSRLILIAAGLAAILLAIAVWFLILVPLLLGDDAQQEVTDPSEPTASRAPSDDAGSGGSTTPAPAPDAGTATGDETPLPLVTYEVFLERDPFDPVVPESAEGASAPGDGAGEGLPTAPEDPASPGTPDDPDQSDLPPGTDPDPGTTPPGSTPPPGESPPSTPPSGGCRTNGQANCDGRIVSVVDIRTDDTGTPVAIVQVDSTIYEVRRGERFAGSFELRAIDGECASLLYGDDAFRLCAGDRVLK
ncbi:MAG: hypothetical protein WEB09_00135 [Nitriliruptor sp.]